MPLSEPCAGPLERGQWDVVLVAKDTDGAEAHDIPERVDISERPPVLSEMLRSVEVARPVAQLALRDVRELADLLGTEETALVGHRLSVRARLRGASATLPRSVQRPVDLFLRNGDDAAHELLELLHRDQLDGG